MADTSSIISALSTKSSKSNPKHLSLISSSSHTNSNSNAQAGPSKNSLSIRLAESAVFLRTKDGTGRNRHNDSRPTMLRGLLTLELVKPTRISKIVLELGAKSVTIWPEGTHGREITTTETHKVFSSTETLFSAVASSQDVDSFLALDDDVNSTFDTDSIPPSSPTSGRMSPDVRSIRTQTSGTITPRRALSSDSSWTRRPAPLTPTTASSIHSLPPAYSEDADYNTDSINAASPTSPVFMESRIRFHSGVHGSRDHAPSKRTRSSKPPPTPIPEEPLPALPTIPHPYAAVPIPPVPRMVAREPLVSSDFIASPSPAGTDSNDDEDDERLIPSTTDAGVNAYQYAQAHARAHSQSQRPPIQNPTPPASIIVTNTDENDDVSRGRRKSRFSLSAIGNRLAKVVSRSRSRDPAKEINSRTRTRDASHTSSRVSTMSGISGVSATSVGSISTESKKVRKSLSLHWRRKKKSATVETGEEGAKEHVVALSGEAQIGSPTSGFNTPTSMGDSASIQSRLLVPLSPKAERRTSTSTRSIGSESHISFAESSHRAPSPSVRSMSGAAGSENPKWKDFPKGTYTYPILFQIPGHAPPSLDTASSNMKKPLSSNLDTYLPQSTLSWHLKASVHRPGAFATKMQVTQEVLVISGPGEDDGEDVANGETVVVERTWDGGMPNIQMSSAIGDPMLSPHINSGCLQYLIAISGRCFPIGGVIPIELTLLPLDKVRIHRLGVTLEQKVEYHAQFKRVVRTDPVLVIPLLSVKEENAQSKEKEKESKHILPLDSDDPDALRKSPLWDVIRKSVLNRMRESETAAEEEEEFIDDDGSSFDSDASESERRISPTALSEIASNLMGPGPWSFSLAASLPLAHASNLDDNTRESDTGKKEIKLKKVDIGRGLIPSNKNRRSNVTVSHLLKCVIRVERPEPDVGVEECELNLPTPDEPAGQVGKKDSKQKSKPKPKKRGKLFDIVVQTPIQILSCRCDVEFASLPGYSEESSLEVQSPYAESSLNHGDTPTSASPSPLSWGKMSTLPPTFLSESCPCVTKARTRETLREQRKAERDSRRERRAVEERRKRKEEERRKRDRNRPPSSPPAMPLPPPPPLTAEQFGHTHSLSRLSPTAFASFLHGPPSPSKQSSTRSQQRMSYSSESTSASSAHSMHPALVWDRTGRASGFPGLGRGDPERRLTGQSLSGSSIAGSYRVGRMADVFQSSQEFEDLVAGHMNETGETPPTYSQLLQEACLHTGVGKYGARGEHVTVMSGDDGWEHMRS